MFLKQGKDEIPNCKPNLVEIFSRLEKISAQTQGMKKQNHEIFGFFQNLEMKSLKYIFFKKKKKIEKIIWREFSSPDFGKTQKFHDFVFSSPEFERSCFGERICRDRFFLLSKGLSGKSLFLNFISSRNEITPSKTFPSIYSQTFPNPIPDQSQSHQSLPLKTKIQFYQNFLPAKRSANHSMFFRRL